MKKEPADISDMRKTPLFSSFAIVLSLVTLALVQPAYAQKGKSKQAAEPGAAAPQTEAAPSAARWGLGYSSSDFLNALPSGFAGFLRLNPENAVHMILGIPSTSPFQFSVTGMFKHVIARSGPASLHMGAGLALGTIAPPNRNNTDFLISIAGVLGIQVPFPGTENVMVHFDGGPGLTIFGDNKDFAMGGFSNLLGLSVVYMF